MNFQNYSIYFVVLILSIIAFSGCREPLFPGTFEGELNGATWNPDVQFKKLEVDDKICIGIEFERFNDNDELREDLTIRGDFEEEGTYNLSDTTAVNGACIKRVFLLHFVSDGDATIATYKVDTTGDFDSELIIEKSKNGKLTGEISIFMINIGEADPDNGYPETMHVTGSFEAKRER